MSGGTDVFNYCGFHHSLPFLVVVEVLYSTGLYSCVNFMKWSGMKCGGVLLNKRF